MSYWSIMDSEWPPVRGYTADRGRFAPCDPCQLYGEQHQPPGPAPPSQMPIPLPMPPQHYPLPHMVPPQLMTPTQLLQQSLLMPPPQPPPRDTPRQIRNKLEKQRRDKLNQSIAELASMVPPVLAANRRIDKTGVLRLTAHYLRSHQYVFGDSIGKTEHDMNGHAANSFLRILKGFLITVTYKGLFVVVSANVQQYLGYSEMDLLGNSIFNFIHEGDRAMVQAELMPRTPGLLGPNGELIIPDEPGAAEKIMENLGKDRKNFVVRFKKLTPRSEPVQYLSCAVDGSLRKSDRACQGVTRRGHMVRRARARGENPCSSGNDIVFIGLARPTVETFKSESRMESSYLEYRTRHSVDGQILQAEQKISLVTGYLPSEVYGLNAMNFMHRDDVRWVIIALREMYDTHRLIGESCYRLMTRNGQFIYLKTVGCLEVNAASGAVTTFVCTNTMVDEVEGKFLIKEMKKKFTLMINNNVEVLPEDDDNKDETESDAIEQVEDPNKIKQVILHLVTNLPSPESGSENGSEDASTSCRYSIIPPCRENILSSIDKIYDVITGFTRDPSPSTSGIPETNDKDETNSQSTLDDNHDYTKQDQHPDHTNRINDKSSLETFENVFKINPATSGDITYDLPTIPDQVLSAAQLENEAGTSYNPVLATKRSNDNMDDNVMMKRKVTDTDIEQVNYPDHDPKQRESTESMNNFESLLGDTSLFELDNALNHLQSMENLEPFPDLQYDEEFQRLMNNCDDDSGYNDDGSKHENNHETAPE